MAIPARFERATFRLGGGPSILLRYGTMLSKVLIFQGFREFGDCSPWRLECLFLIRKGRFLISFSNFGGRTFSHMLISTLLSKGVGVTGKPGQFLTKIGGFWCLHTRLVPNSAPRASVRIFSALGWDRTPHPFRIIAHLRAFVYFLGGGRSIQLSYVGRK